MLEFNEACDLILEKTGRLDTQKQLIEDSVGYVLAQDIVSPINLAPFRNSAMDGFAVESGWLKECSRDNPVTLPIGPTSYAGKSAAGDVSEQRSLKVMTGARVPVGFDAVVPFEDTEFSEHEVRFFTPVKQGHHVREPGEDVIEGQKLFSEGTRIGRLDIGILANIGMRSVSVYRKPSVAIVGTGDELIDPGEELTGDQIYDSNTYTIQALIAAFCEKIERICRVPDREEEILRALNSPHDVIVTCGGVSAGERDLVIDIAESCGWQRVFHKVRVKPGKPVYFAVRGSQFLFGLPGNPLSATVSASVFLIPALKKMSGIKEYRLRVNPAILPSGEKRKCGRKLIWPGYITEEDGRKVARYSPKTSSSALSALIGTDGLIIQDAGKADPEETAVETVLWDDLLGR